MAGMEFKSLSETIFLYLSSNKTENDQEARPEIHSRVREDRQVFWYLHFSEGSKEEIAAD